MVNWLWSDKMGELQFQYKGADNKTYKYKYNIYAANCLGCYMSEWVEVDKTTGKKQGKYCFQGFWSDKDHLLRCLGLKKSRYSRDEPENIYPDLKKLKLNTYFKKDIEIISSCFIKAFKKLTIEYYYKEPKKD